MTVINSKTVKTRKEHHCFGCGRNMPKGTIMTASTNVDGGEISTDYWCKVCETYWEKHMQPDDEITFKELRSEDIEGWSIIQQSVEVTI